MAKDDLIEILFENIDLDKTLMFLTQTQTGNQYFNSKLFLNIDNELKNNGTFGFYINKLIFINLTLINTSVHFFKYENKVDLNILFTNIYSDSHEKINKNDFFNILSTISAVIKAQHYEMGLEPSCDKDTQFLCDTKEGVLDLNLYLTE